VKNVLVVAPHPDDETLGCGGTLLKHSQNGDHIHLAIMTQMNKEEYGPERVEERALEIESVVRALGVKSVHQLTFTPTRLDTVPIGDIVSALSTVVNDVKPDTVYAPYPGDVHTDHRVVFDAVVSCSKWFRYPFVRSIMIYETISETEFGLNPDSGGFKPNVFVDIGKFLDRKIEVFNLYRSEVGAYPFPRCEKSIRALATLRGSTAGCQAAESFMLLREIR